MVFGSLASWSTSNRKHPSSSCTEPRASLSIASIKASRCPALILIVTMSARIASPPHQSYWVPSGLRANLAEHTSWKIPCWRPFLLEKCASPHAWGMTFPSYPGRVMALWNEEVCAMQCVDNWVGPGGWIILESLAAVAFFGVGDILLSALFLPQAITP